MVPIILPHDCLCASHIYRRCLSRPIPTAKTVYYPGDAAHMKAYRESACLHTHYSVRCVVPTLCVLVDDRVTMDLVYMR